MNPTDLTTAIVGREHERCDALLRGDLHRLGDLLSDRLVFVHANATSDTKASLLAKMATGAIVYRSLVVEDPVVLGLAPGIALLTGRLTADLLVREQPKRVSNLTMSVWALEDEEWRLVAYQPTPIVS
jgi:hypothetical protein